MPSQKVKSMGDFADVTIDAAHGFGAVFGDVGDAPATPTPTRARDRVAPQSMVVVRRDFTGGIVGHFPREQSSGSGEMLMTI